jgi:hypothetical protein
MHARCQFEMAMARSRSYCTVLSQSPCELMRVCLASRLDLLGKWRMTVPDFLRWSDFKFGEDRVSASRSFLLRAETFC